MTKASLDNPEVVAALCERLSAGESMTAICSAPDMPCKGTVYARMATDPEFYTVIARAREAQQDAEADRCIDMADEATPEDWQVVKLRIWARQWRAAKLAPKKYGERVTHAGDKDNPVALRGDVTVSEMAGALLSVITKAGER